MSPNQPEQRVYEFTLELQKTVARIRDVAHDEFMGCQKRHDPRMAGLCTPDACVNRALRRVLGERTSRN